MFEFQFDCQCVAKSKGGVLVKLMNALGVNGSPVSIDLYVCLIISNYTVIEQCDCNYTEHKSMQFGLEIITRYAWYNR